MINDFTVTQKRALAVLTVVALAFGAYFLRTYFVLIVVAAVAAYLFTPLFRRFRHRMGPGLAATCTLLCAIVAVAVPITLVIVLAVVQISEMVEGINNWVATTDLGALGNRLLGSANELLGRIPFLDITLTMDSIRDTMVRVGQTVGEAVLRFAGDTAGSALSTLTSAIIFLYVFLSLLIGGHKVVDLIRHLNPLGEEVSDLYIAKIGAMVKATVKGQFIIAVCQGVAGAISIYIGGIHDAFFMFAIFLTALSFIPLGSGILAIPVGIAMALFGNVVGGVFVVVFHVVATTNIDNVLRPLLVPKEAHLNAALMLLSVFAGLQMFGFWGIILGPVLMIIIVTTLSVYLAVYKGVQLEHHHIGTEAEAEVKPRTSLWKSLVTRFTRPKAKAALPEKEDA
jgi:predicted PurR-regulated permease PerM